MQDPEENEETLAPALDGDTDTLDDAPDDAPRAGRCAIVGRPNVGKSTLLNALLQQKLVIATARPGTTRTSVLGVYMDEDPPTQVAFVDTPGIARPRTALHHVLVEQAELGLTDTDVVVFMTEVPKFTKDGPATPGFLSADEEPLKALAEVKAPVILAINKVDRLKQKELLFPLIEAYTARREFAAVVPLSATRKTNLDALMKEIRPRLPEGLMYDPEFLTDRPERFFVAELIRESVISQTHAEVPYGAAVIIDSFIEVEGRARINATIVVEKDSHKGIVIGARGARIKDIGTHARKEITHFLGRPVHLELWVKVIPGWTADPNRARQLATSEEL